MVILTQLSPYRSLSRCIFIVGKYRSKATELFLFHRSVCVTSGIFTDEVLPFPAQSCEGGEGTVYTCVLLE